MSDNLGVGRSALKIAGAMLMCLLLLSSLPACNDDGAEADTNQNDVQDDVEDDLQDESSDQDDTLPDGEDDTPPEPLALSADSCAQVEVDVSSNPGQQWRVEGSPLVFPEMRESLITFRAPAVARTTILALISESGERFAEIVVSPPSTDDDRVNLVDGLVPDCGPFAHGVASGDPHSDSVLLWTRLEPQTEESMSLRWEVSESWAFDTLVGQGEGSTLEVDDYTFTVEVTGLEPATTYYYRFLDNDDETSVIGRTKTAPSASADHLRFALVSCSSLYSGYLNAYRRLAERDDIDLLIHLGDVIYDYADEDELIRVPEPPLPDPANLDEHRMVHRHYLTDPDYRAARAAHPWFAVWDNHDIGGDANSDPPFGGGVQAFREYIPTRLSDSERPEVAYRSLQFGDLVDLTLIDVLLWKNQDLLPDSEAFSMLGSEQFEWLANELSTSTATWRLLGNQKLFAPLTAPIDVGGSTWLGFPETRTQLLEFLTDSPNGPIDNVVILSGDAHFTVMADSVIDPNEGYDPDTGEGSLAVEFLGGSISRGNVDETLGPVATEQFLEGLEQSFLDLNPHFVHTDLINHGYGLIDVTPERVTVEWWLSPILEVSDVEAFDRGVVVESGSNHWSRELREEPTR